MLDDDASAHDAGATPDTENRREQPDAAGDLLARKLIADDPEGEREDAAGGSLERSTDDHERQRAGDRGQKRAERQDHQRPQQNALLAVHVAEATKDRGADRGSEEIRRQDPRDTRLRCVQRMLEGRQRRDHGAAQHRIGKRAERQDRQRYVGGDSLRLGGHVLPGRGGQERRAKDSRGAAARAAAPIRGPDNTRTMLSTLMIGETVPTLSPAQRNVPALRA
jgi:hypothetical protein